MEQMQHDGLSALIKSNGCSPPLDTRTVCREQWRVQAEDAFGKSTNINWAELLNKN
jgi:hypothetical protein